MNVTKLKPQTQNPVKTQYIMKGSLIMQHPVRDDPQAIQTAAGKDEVVVNT